MIGTDTKNWKFFEFNKIFEIKKGFYNKKPEASGEGKIPFIGASDKNHGITEYYTYEEIESTSKTGVGNNASVEEKIFKPNAICVTNNGSVGYAYYIEQEFTCSHDVNPLYLKNGEFNYFTGMFVSSIIMKDRYRWGYGRKWRPIRMANSKIKLPVVMRSGNFVLDDKHTYSNDGYIPDWDYMESYIKSLDYKIPETGNTSIPYELNTSDWQEFLLIDLFYTSMGNGIDAINTTNTMPKYKYVTRNRNNNGIVDVVDKIEGEVPFDSGDMTLALGGSYLGSCFVQNAPFYTAQNVGVLKSKVKLSIYAKLFIATISRHECRVKYQAFGRELNSHFRRDFVLKLPALKDGYGNFILDEDKKFSSKGYIPDWNFMEKYIQLFPNGDLI